jgi:hypothetical protein
MDMECITAFKLQEENMIIYFNFGPILTKFNLQFLNLKLNLISTSLINGTIQWNNF